MKIVHSEERYQIVGSPRSIHHCARCLGQLNIIGDTKDRADRVRCGGDEWGKVQNALDAHELHALTAAIAESPILHRQKDLQIAGDHGTVDDITSRVVKREDCEVGEAHPSIIEKSLEIADNPLGGGACIQLGAKGIND